MAQDSTLYIRKDVGRGDPIVLLHGMFGEGSQWDKIVSLLKDDYRVISLDLLGHGKSPRPANATYSPDEHVKYLHNTLVKLDATKNLTVVGYSMGGAVALAYSKKFQQNIEQLYLLSTPFYLKPEQMVTANYSGSLILTKASTGLYKLVEKIVGSGKADWAIHYTNKSQLFHKMIGASDNKLEADVVRKNLEMLVRKYDFVGNLKGLNVPTTFYAGSKDTFIVHGQLNALKQFNKNMYIQSLDILKVDHMLVQNLPKEMAKLLKTNKNNLLNVGIDIGKSKPIVMLHGIESSSSYWQGLAPALADKNRVIAIDLLGFGKSPKPLNVAYSLQDQAKWVYRTLDTLGLKDFDLVGHSLGSLVALEMAAAYPTRVKSLTLLSPVLSPNNVESRNFLIKGASLIKHFTDSSFAYEQLTKTIGAKHVNHYLPSIRSIENSINNQNAYRMAKKADNVKTLMIYGADDKLVDKHYLNIISGILNSCKVVELKNVSHNFALFKPSLFLSVFKPNVKYSHRLKPATIIPPTFAKQIVKLATPILLLKSLVYIGYGLLIFTKYAPYAITIGLALYVLINSYKIINGAFSLRNENLSYIGYVLLGIFGGIIAFALIRHPELSVKISVFVICGIVLLSGFARLLVAIAWTKNKALKHRLLISGAIMILISLLAFAGGIYSIYLILYSLAGIVIFRGLQMGAFAIGALAMAYVRGFNRE